MSIMVIFWVIVIVGFLVVEVLAPTFVAMSFSIAGIVGLIMVGAMTSNTVIFKTVLEFKMKGQSLMNVQSALDSIFKGIVPLLMTFGCYKLLNKKVNVIAIIFGIVALGIDLSLLGIC